MKIAKMTNDELIDALIYMSEVPKSDPCYSGFNFDEGEYKTKLAELNRELNTRED